MTQLARRIVIVIACTSALSILFTASVLAHSGPPYPIVQDQVTGPYRIAVWTDPDSTDDGSAAGRFWVTVHPAAEGATLPDDTRARVSVTPLDRPADAGSSAGTDLVGGDVSHQFAAVVLDHEGAFRVKVVVDGALGRADVDSEVQATYDLRPPPALIFLYLFPFVLVGALWVKLLMKRRRAAAPSRTRSAAGKAAPLQ
jgi:hypothetical protein